MGLENKNTVDLLSEKNQKMKLTDRLVELSGWNFNLNPTLKLSSRFSS